MVMLFIGTGCTPILQEHGEAAAVRVENIKMGIIPDGVYE